VSKTRSGITLIRGDGTFPQPKVRRIYPDKDLLWKYILQVLIIWIFALLALVVSTTFFIGITSRRTYPPFIATPEFQLFTLLVFIVLTLILGPLVLLSLFFYVRSMEFIVHGDEIVVEKGLFNKTVKHCPFRTITNISTEVGLLDRVFKIGCINIQTSGSSGTSGGRSEEKLEGLRVYSEIREYIITQIRVVGGSGSPPKEILQQAILEELSLVKGGFRDLKRKKKR
jgi:membrane protein YdbS with pleckstrin-like domain